MVITDGRRSCLQRTLEAFWEHWDGPVTRKLIINDAADPGYAAWIDEHFPTYDRVHHDRRLGFGGAIQSGWDHVGRSDWIIHQEDDLMLNRKVPGMEIISVLRSYPYLAQMALTRQPWNQEERLAGGQLLRSKDDFEPKQRGRRRWMEHRRWFTTNFSVYPGSLTRLGWPQITESEGNFSIRLFREGMLGVAGPDVKCGYWGEITDPPWTTHIGDQRMGSGY